MEQSAFPVLFSFNQPDGYNFRKGFIMLKFNFGLKTYPDNYPDNARVYITVASQPIKEVDGKELKAVSSKCYALGEVDDDVNRLIKELKKAREEAKIFFEKEDNKVKDE